METKSTNVLTISGMILTVIMSIGGTFVTNLIDSRVQDTKIQNLTYNQQNIVGDLRTMATKVGEVDVANARTATAVENLVVATQQLTKTSQSLLIAVSRLER